MHKAVWRSLCAPVFAVAPSATTASEILCYYYLRKRVRSLSYVRGSGRLDPTPEASGAGLPAGAMASSSDSWVRQTARRIERNSPSRLGERRWAEIADASDGVRPALHTGRETLWETRMDLSIRRPFFSPQRSTFVVEGRPVQVMCRVDRLITVI